METSIIIYVLLGLAVVILLYTTFNLLRKNEKAEDIIVSQREFIEKFQESIEFTQKKLDKIDEKGTFKSDDEIGWFFNEIKKLQNAISQFKIDL
jgi:peptidoglycan hydrolase CwlO-like protein|tara:strand:- start:197 stop:478 length:282 start_codon:yes stop_codon:yes gene_type:complete